MTGQMVAMALYGTIAGAVFGGLPAEKLGRKTTLFWVAILYLVSSIGCALAPNVFMLMLFRFVGGLSVGASSVVAPMYIAEISPSEKRGQLTALFQFNIVFGILIAYFSNWLIGTNDPSSWRLMLGIVAIPSLLFVVLMLYVPESPRWLVTKKGKTDEALKILNLINPATAAATLETMELHSNSTKETNLAEFFSGRYRFPILLAFLFAFFNQVSGINAVIYYAPRIFEAAGLATSSALLSSVGIGVVNLVFTMLGLIFIDRFGRRFLMYIGSFGYIISLSMVSMAFFGLFPSGGMTIPFLLFAFIAAHAIGQGAVIWVFISEIFPNNIRSWGNSLGSSTHWVFAALIAGNFPVLAGWLGQGSIFAFFALMMFFQLLFVWKLMPETKGVSLEDIEKDMVSE
jgi:sugar porter (SP) family MFS transporter